MVITVLLVGTQPILPLLMLSQTRFGFTSEINAVVTLIGAVSIVLIVVATRVIEREVDPFAGAGRKRRSRKGPS